MERVPTVPIIKQDRIHGNPVVYDWAGAVVQKPLGIPKCFGMDGRTDGRTNTARCRVATNKTKLRTRLT